MASVYLGWNTEAQEAVRVGDIERRSGLYILGKPGMGKSALMINMASQDLAHGHGLFFLDPHGDAITDLIRGTIFDDSMKPQLFDPDNDNVSFGINLLQCPNLTSLQARTDTYTRAYNVFQKLWEDQWGVWLQLILQNTLWALIENPDYTLAEVPMFLNPQNKDFREEIIGNIKHNPAVVNFWRDEFFMRREQEQQERADAALTRINTLLTHPYVRHIVGQKRTTIQFYGEGFKRVWLFKLSANLAPDIKKFIGTILISELLHAIRNRPEDERSYFCVYVDEFQNFVNVDDFRDLITEGRKFGVATTFAHQERYGQFAGNQRLMGATLATANKIIFQATVRDSQELAPEFAQEAPDTRTRLGGELIISPRPVHDIWDRGYTHERVMEIREKYFWLVDLLRTKPGENYYMFDHNTVRDLTGAYNPVNYSPSAFSDWDMYRASSEMLRRGISLLNEHLYRAMVLKPHEAHSYRDYLRTDRQLDTFFEIIECFGGIFGWRPAMEAYLSNDMKEVFCRRANENEERDFRETTHDKERENAAREREMALWERQNPFSDPNSQIASVYRYWGERPISQLKLEAILKEHRPTPWSTDDLPTHLNLQMVNALKNAAIHYGFTQGELNELIQWRPRTIFNQEKNALQELIDIVIHIGYDSDRYEREKNRVNRTYTSIMSVDLMAAKFGENHKDLPYEQIEPYLRTITERTAWQMIEIQTFIIYVLLTLPLELEKNPVYLPSGQYDISPKREHTQGEMNDIMARELSNLPRFTAYAKITAENQTRAQKIRTHPLPDFDYKYNFGFYSGTDRDYIEEEIRERQVRWTQGSTQPPPARKRRG
jgi:hypothetical protein